MSRWLQTQPNMLLSVQENSQNVTSEHFKNADPHTFLSTCMLLEGELYLVVQIKVFGETDYDFSLALNVIKYKLKK